MVQRLAVVGQQFFLQRFNPDSLRIQALDPATVRQRRANGNLIFTLDPSPGRATWTATMGCGYLKKNICAKF